MPQINYYQFNYNGDMIKFESKYIDLFVTQES